LRKFKAQIPVQGINEVTKTIHYAASLEIKSRFSNWETKIDCTVLPKITGMIPATFVDSSDWGIPEGFMSADENFNRPNSIDILLGLQRFWEIEELPNKTWTAEEMLCKEHFKKHTARDDIGRYILRLPRREDEGRLGESYEKANRRFHQLERRFQEHPDLHQAYSEFMQEYEELVHMNQINEDASNPADLIS